MINQEYINLFVEIRMSFKKIIFYRVWQIVLIFNKFETNEL